MNKLKLKFCQTIMKLDYIPAYRRLYEVNDDMEPINKRWEYMKRGLWGFYLLDTIGFLDDYVEESYLSRERPK